MWVFVVLLIAPMLIHQIAIGKNGIDYEKQNKNAILFFFVFLTVLLALRHESVGKDTGEYIYYFNKISAMNLNEIGAYSLEMGFKYYIKIVSLFTQTPQVFLAITAFVTIAMIYPTYKRLCVDASLTIVLFCTMSTFVMMFSGIRQMIAIGIGFFAYEFTRKKKWIPFIIAVFVAMLFHTSAFMLFFMYPLYHARITKRWLFAVVPALAIIFVFNRQIFSVLSVILEHYTKYKGEITQTGAYTMIILFAVFVVFAFLIPDEECLDDEVIGLRNFMLFSLTIQMFAPLHTIAMRMNYYYIIFIPLLLPKIVESRSERWSEIAIAGRHIMVVFFLMYFFMVASSGGSLGVFPYHFFWENV